MSTGVVIGIGGTGAQVISRINAFVESERIDQAFRSRLQFLAIDALNLEQQHDEVVRTGLSRDKYFNLIPPGGFNPAQTLRMDMYQDPYLRHWWADSYRPEDGNVVEALKASRRLGRLAFYNRKGELTDRIQQALRDAQEVERDQLSAGSQAQDGAPGEVRVFIVASSVGGTGSSGFLEVVHSVYAAAQLAGMPTIKIYAVIYLPGVYREAIQSGAFSSMMVRQHNANAFAFFREVDHFMLNRSAFFEDFDRNRAGRRATGVGDGRLVHQMFLMDSNISGVGTVGSIDDIHAVTAESLYQLMMTDHGAPLLGQAQTNWDIAFGARDAYNHPLAYCSMGVGAVVFPGDTYRQYLRARYMEHFIRTVLIPNSAVAASQDSTEPGAAPGPQGSESAVAATARADRGKLVQSVEHSVDNTIFRQALEGVALVDEPKRLVEIGMQAAATLERKPELATASRLLAEVKRLTDGGALSDDLRQSYQRAVDDVTPQIDGALLGPLLAAGESLPFMQRTLQRLAKVYSDRAREVGSSHAETAAAMDQVMDKDGIQGPELRDLLDDLQGLEKAGIFAKLTGKAEERRRSAAAKVGRAVEKYTSDLVKEPKQIAEAELARRVHERVLLYLDWARDAESALAAMSQELRVQWQQDRLIGKDSGPKETQLLIPEDVQPEVEDSELALRVWEEALRDFRSSYGGPEQQALVAQLYGDLDEAFERSGGILAVGSDIREYRESALAGLRQALRDRAERLAIHDSEGEPRFPADLAAAADSEATLTDDLDGLLKLARGVYWTFIPARVQYTTGDKLQGAVVTYAATGDAHRHLKAKLGPDSIALREGADPERAVAIMTQYAVPIHALAEADLWQRDYRQVIEGLAMGRTDVKPPHINSNYAQQLEPLLPEYFSRDTIIEELAHGLVIEMLGGGDEFPRIVNPSALRRDLLPLDTRKWPQGQFTATAFTASPGSNLLAPAGSPVELGRTMDELVVGLGARDDLIKGIEATWERLRTAAGPQSLLEAVQRLTDAVVPVFRRAAERQADEASQVVLDRLEGALAQLRDQLELDAARG